jgi:hypothetical protein
MAVSVVSRFAGGGQSIQPGFDGIVRALWVLPVVPPSLNRWERMHWSQRNRIKGSWEQYAWAFARTSAIGPADWVFASAEIIFRMGAHRDLSNYDSTLWKIFPDVLQRIGVLADDTEEQMKRGPVSMYVDKTLRGQARDPRQEGMTRIALLAKVRD